jgi:hypothetical protein
MIGYLNDRAPGESIQAFFARQSDEALGALARGESLPLNCTL